MEQRNLLLEAQAAEFDAAELTDARLEVRPRMDRSTVSRIQTAYDKQYDLFAMAEARQDISEMLGEEDEPRSVRERLCQQQEQPAPWKKEKDRDR